ncbi:MAG TPA: hypothetical protein VIM64_15580 [Puia sp.]
MTSIIDKIQETIKVEELRNAGDAKFVELKQFIKTMKELGVFKKSEYTLPLRDTIGKTYFPSLNRRVK